MRGKRIWALIALALLAAPAYPAGGPPAAVPPAGDDARRVAARIDELIEAAYAREKVRPAPLADDATFLRRLSLDLTGKILPVAEARRFLDDAGPHKRARLIDQLLDGPGHATHMSNVWRDLLLPEAAADIQRRYLLTDMERWLRASFAANQPYDRMVRELLTYPLRTQTDNAFYARIYNGQGEPTPLSFYMAKEGKPDELAASVSRLFLGVRIECAQCHDHPFGKWKREEFWGQAAFFAGVRRSNPGFVFSPLSEVADRRELNIPSTDRVAQASFLDGKAPRWKYKVGARETLAEWMTAPDNPFFARAAVNRAWAQFFGVGIVDPVDDMSDQHVPSHPELLDELAREFVAHGFDLQFLARAITSSRTYQRASGGDSDPRLFARMPLRGLTAEQLYESLQVATGTRDGVTRQQRLFSIGLPRNAFMDKFAAQERATEYQTSIPQALTLMNNKLMIDATHPDRGRLLGAVAGSTFMTREGKVETLFLAALSRRPTPEERARFARYVEKGGATGSEKAALGDVFWALLNSTEFLFNH